MNDIIVLLTELRRKDINFWVDGETLKYDAPKNILTSSEIYKIRQNKEKIIDYFKIQYNINNKKIISNRGRPSVIPLSYSQRGLWFFHQLDGLSATYNIPVSWRLSGELDQSALEDALSDVVCRHESLRTIFPEGEVPRQVILEPEHARAVLVRADVAETGLAGAVKLAAGYCFDLAREIPLRAWLFRLGATEHVLVLVVHHIAADGWSLAPLWRDLGVAYAARRQGEAPRFQALPVQYADYTLWQQELLGDEADPQSTIARQLAFWQETLSGLPDQLDLPTDRPRPSVASYNGDSVAFRLDEELHRNLAALARRGQASLFMVLQAGLAVLLSRLGCGDDIPLGSPIAGRTDGALDELVGFFLNTLVLRTDTSGNPSFVDLLARVRSSDLACYANQDVPFERLVEVLNPRRSMARHPLFQVMLVLQNNITARFQLPGLTSTQERAGTQTAKFDLLLTLSERRGADGAPQGIAARIEYATDLFDRETVERFAVRLVRLFEAVAADPDQRIGGIDLLSHAERHQLLTEWNDTAHVVPEATLPELFEQQVARTPDATALVFEDTSLSYAELNARANRLAHLLIADGIGPEDIVAVALPRSVEMVVSLLGILKAGAAYLPLDPDYPIERLAFMLEDARPRRLISTTEISARLTTDVPLLWLDAAETAEALDIQPDIDPSDATRRSPLLPHNPAYVIYTSGSTGRPKGVVVDEGAIVNRLEWMQSAYLLGPDDTILQKTPSSFDVSVWEFFWPLIVGATLVVAKPEGHKDPAYLASLIQTRRVTVLHFVPSMLQAFLQEPTAITCSSLRLVICSGEALSGSLRALFDDSFSIPLHNLYGPTEAAVDVSYWQSSPLDAVTVPIGRPIWNMQLHVLDDALQLAPVGVSGELYIAGVGLARGYLNRPELTAERFVANPYGASGSRMYRTGDLARWRADGVLEFFGRADQQVKLRGFRIEPGEIEAVLADDPGTAQAAVIVREDVPGDKRLVAYVVPAPGETVDPAALRGYVSGRLPDYMVPSAIVSLAALPLTPNGKLDRRALPAPDLTPTIIREPRTPQEEILAGLFAEILGVDRIGIDDNFFDLGGHSLLATRLISRVRSTLGVELSIRSLFEAPTVAGLAVWIGEAEAARPALRIMPRSNVGPLSYSQRGLWFFHQLDGLSATYNIPVSWRLSGELDQSALEDALSDVVCRHESLRTIFPEGEVPRQVILEPEHARAVLVRADVAETGLAGAVKLAAGYCFDLAREIPLRAWLFRLGATEHVLVLVVHHIAADGWSLAPLWRDLGVAYAARRQGEAPRFQALPVQYADYTLWQQELLGDEADPQSTIARQLAFWQETLSGLPDQLDLPTDRPRPSVASYNGDSVAFRLDEELHRNLAALARRGQASLFMVLQAGLAVLLSRLGCGDDIPLGSPIAGRTDGALDELVGFFLNTLVLRTDTSGNPSFVDLLARVRSSDLACYANQDVPFERLVEVLNPRRSMARHPLFQVMLVLQNNITARFQLPGLTSTQERAGTQTAKFDLLLTLSERRGADGAPQGIAARIEYATDLFDRETVERFAVRLVRLFEAVAADPDQRIGGIDLLSHAERHQLLTEWNDTAHVVPEATLPELFEQQVARTPDATALVFEDTSLSYAELNARANRLAHLLIADGIGPEDIVAVALPRSVEMVVSLLGILKAGAAYLPLDPDYPIERLAFMLEDARPRRLISTTEISTRLTTDVPLLWLDAAETAEALDIQPDIDPSDATRRSPLLPHNPAYVIYTSGSTGKPKGVVVDERAIVNRLEWMQSAYLLGPDDTILQKTPSSFDVSVWEFFWPLIVGATLVVAKPEGHKDPAYLASLIQTRRVTVLHFVPSMLQAFLQEPTAITCSSLRLVICSGEALSGSLRALFDDSFSIPLHNLYGPTEAAVDVSYWQSSPLDAVTVPIGRPIWNMQLHVLDDALQLAPVGVSGELYIAGVGLARGYLNRPELTAERFVANPYGASGSRMYRTGDLARWRADGVLEFFGRADQQVKLRGFRIEPGEIEAALVDYPGTAQTAVIVREDVPGDKRLVAYVVPTPGETVDPAALRGYVSGRLPDYMVPSAIVSLAALPLTPNGKLDRRALPVPDLTPTIIREPRTPQEEILAGLFAEILGVDRIGIDDNFFDLGGHSLLATRLISRIRSTLGVELSIRSLFEAPTVAKLAGRLDEAETQDPFEVLLPIRKNGNLPPLFCIHASMGLTWAYCGLIQHLTTDCPIYGLQARGFNLGDRLPASIREMALDYIHQIRTVQPTGPYHLLGWSSGGFVAHEIACILRSEKEEVPLLAILDIYPAAKFEVSRLERARIKNEDEKISIVNNNNKVVMSQIRAEVNGRKRLLSGDRAKNILLDSGKYQECQIIRENILKISENFSPSIFDGDIILFITAKNPLSKFSPSWRNYISGNIYICELNCRHQDMIEPQFMKLICESILKYIQ